MEEYNVLLKKILKNALEGANAHVSPRNDVEALTVDIAGKIIDIAGKIIPGSPHTIWQVLKHINYWQERFISYIKDESTSSALTAKEGWSFPEFPSNEEELENEIQKFNKSLSVAENLNKGELIKKAQKYK